MQVRADLKDATDMQAKLLEAMRDSIAETVGGQRIGIAFSGGVDSALVSRVCSEMGYDATLLTVGFAGSHDILFAKKVNESLRLPHRILEIDPGTFLGVSKKINRAINTRNLSWNENCIAFYYVSVLARGLGIGTVVTANGIDELFCGYDSYRRMFHEGGPRIVEAVDAKLENELAMMKAVNLVSSEFGVQIVQPLLAAGFVKHAKTIPLSEKIHGPGDLMRKHIIRKLARRVGVPGLSCTKRKKALQYGSKIHRALLKAGVQLTENFRPQGSTAEKPVEQGSTNRPWTTTRGDSD